MFFFFSFKGQKSQWAKEDMLGYLYFLPPPPHFSKPSLSGSVKSVLFGEGFNSLPNDKIFIKSRFKALADNKIVVTQKLKFVLERVQNIVGKGENAGHQHFLHFPPQCFLRLSFPEVFKVRIVWERVKAGNYSINPLPHKSLRDYDKQAPPYQN